jgi:hypothetical protein
LALLLRKGSKIQCVLDAELPWARVVVGEEALACAWVLGEEMLACALVLGEEMLASVGEVSSSGSPTAVHPREP